MPEVILRAEAKRLGLKRYFTGKPCKHGHMSERYAIGNCVECDRSVPAEERKANHDRWRAANKDKCSAYNARWQAANRDRMAQANLKHYYRNREEINKDRQIWRIENPEEARIQDNRQRLARYGLTKEALAEMLAAQNYKCAICGTSEPGGNHGRFAVDHDHETGATRGLLCMGCNLALGHARDSVAVLKGMIAYLEQHQTAADAHLSTHQGNAAKADTQASQQPVPA